MSEVDRYDVESIARQAYYDAVNNTDEKLRDMRQDLHMSMQDIRDGLSELTERIWNLEQQLKENK